MSRPAEAKPGGGPSCSIFVGNVPYDAQEDELRELFGKAGAVTSVRVVCDKETKQPKGYAFCDFADPAGVQAAIEKLNNVEYNGRRLRVDCAERELHNPLSAKGPAEDRPPTRSGGGAGGSSGGPGGGGGSGDPMSLPPPIMSVAERLARLREQEAAEQARIVAADAAERAEIARLVETLTPMQIFHILGQMQRLALRAPEVARALAAENPQLCLALQHAQFLVGLIDEPALPTEPEVRERARNVKETVFQTGPAGPAAPEAGAPLPVTGVPLPTPNAGTQSIQAPLPIQQQPLPTQQASPTPQSAGLLALPDVPAGSTPQRPQPPPAGAGLLALPPSPGTGLQGGLPGAPGEQLPQAFLERLVQLTPAQIDQLPHHAKVQLLTFLQTLPPQGAAAAAPAAPVAAAAATS